MVKVIACCGWERLMVGLWIMMQPSPVEYWNWRAKQEEPVLLTFALAKS